MDYLAIIIDLHQDYWLVKWHFRDHRDYLVVVVR